ncbi:hypothetical protein EYF80_036769 [Liparis tanakae]|uniref:Uncharacterized protein n=1 Tax=Liparis tanakae TaxID=230148 RepID=A0A4Z2GHJ6_9TELE|nr:hypothetical protein EYF80_036769 [Liparis tanakae]
MWVGRSEEEEEDMVMRVEHARSPLRCPPVAETRRGGDEEMRRRGGEGSRYYLLLLDMAY